MPRKKSPMLTDHELRLMDVLWREGRATVAEVRSGLAPPPLTYSTVLTTMRTLEKKGYIAHEEDGRAFVYRPLAERTDAAKSAMRYLLDRFFGDSPGALAVALLDDPRLSDDDLARLRDLITKRRRVGK